MFGAVMEVTLTTPFQGQSVFTGEKVHLSSKQVILRQNNGKEVIIPRSRIDSMTFLSTTPRQPRKTTVEPSVSKPAPEKPEILKPTPPPAKGQASNQITKIDWNDPAVRQLYTYHQERLMERYHREHFRQQPDYLKMSRWSRDTIRQTITDAQDEDYKKLAAKKYDELPYIYFTTPIQRSSQTYPQLLLMEILFEVVYHIDHGKSKNSYSLRLSFGLFVTYLREHFPQYVTPLKPMRRDSFR